MSVPVPYYSEAGISIYCGDCETILPALPEAEGGIDVVVTSPPYNMGLQPAANGSGMYRPSVRGKGRRFRAGYGQHTDALEQTEYNAWQRRILGLCWGTLNERGAIFYNHRPRVEFGKLRLPLDLDFPEGLPLRQIITWDRGTGIDISLNFYCSVYEWILLFAKPAFRLVDHAASGFGNMWRLGMATGETEHPAAFPVSLPMHVLRTTGAQMLLDPFMGSGTSLVAAKRLGRRAIGIELEERYCELAVQRLAQGVLPSFEQV